MLCSVALMRQRDRREPTSQVQVVARADGRARKPGAKGFPARGLHANLLRQLALRPAKRVLGDLAMAGRDLPGVAPPWIPPLAHQMNVAVLGDRHDSHHRPGQLEIGVAALLAVWLEDLVLAQPQPAVVEDNPARLGAPRVGSCQVEQVSHTRTYVANSPRLGFCRSRPQARSAPG